MKCPSCRTDNPDGQKFCGACGHKLEVICAHCQASNPPQYKFCGSCGASLISRGSLTLARSGLITQVNQTALDMLGQQQMDMQGKPFTLFVESSDLVIFFTHMNELLSTSQKQIFEISLKHKKQNPIYSQIECRMARTKAKGDIELLLSEVSNGRHAAVQLQNQQDLLGLIFSVTNNISTVGKKHSAHSIEDALKKICLFTKSDFAFIYGVNRPLRRLDPLHQWHRTWASSSGKSTGLKSVPLSKVKNIIVRLHQEKRLVIHDITSLTPPEGDELGNWLSSGPAAAICYMIYSEKVPIGAIGVAQKTPDNEWTPESIALVQFFGNFMAGRLGSAAHGLRPASALPSDGSGLKNPDISPEIDTVATISDKRVDDPDADGLSNNVPDISKDQETVENWTGLPDMSQPMQFGAIADNPSLAQQPVFARDDGLVMITCPKCGSQEPLPLTHFDKIGNAIGVTCPCRNQFAAVLEKRRSMRKKVHLEGYFSVSGDLSAKTSDGSIWGPMMVIDISKFGLRFLSEKANLVHPEDILMVRFNLDNTNQALIHKAVKVISVSDLEVGCQFEGADSYDITLGFYFM